MQQRLRASPAFHQPFDVPLVAHPRADAGFGDQFVSDRCLSNV